MKNFRLFILISFIFSLLFTSCNSSFSEQETTSKSASETVFEVTVPEELKSNSFIYLEILDEVTGTALNPKRYEMRQKDKFTLFVRISLSDRSMIRYRYVRHAEEDQIEFNSHGEQIYYRTYLADRPAVIHDKVASWSNGKTIFNTGEVSGYIFDAQTNLPIRGIHVEINGSTDITTSDGFYLIRDIPIGEYKLIAFHPNDLYEPFQQSAVIADNAVTPASFGLELANIVEVTFNLEAPVNTFKGAPIRFLGDTSALGNIFSESTGGTSIIASRAPFMEYIGDNKYSITLKLAAGSDLRYKYSLGDGFFNAESSEDGLFLTRQLIVPKNNITVTDQVANWASGSKQPIIFKVTAPSNTPPGEYVSIQFNPYIWMRPIQMWKTGENEWIYALYGPFEYLDNSQFRFCRNDQCGLADDIATTGYDGSGYVLKLTDSEEPRTITYEIKAWNYLNSSNYQIIKNKDSLSRPAFVKGIQFSSRYDPGYLPYLSMGFVDAAVNGANIIVFSPTRQIVNGELPHIQYKSDRNISINDLSAMSTYAKDAGLRKALYPQLSSDFPSIIDFWNSTSPSYNWWIEWYSQYERFILDFTTIAEKDHYAAIVLGGNSILPALPSGKLPNGNFSNTPYDFEKKWQLLIEKIREAYNGQIIFAIPSTITDQIDYSFLTDVDAFLVETDSPLTSNTSPSVNELTERFINKLDNYIYKIVEKYQKPVIIGVNYSSLDGSASDCINLKTPCSEYAPGKSNPALAIDLNEQADIYQAIFDAVIDRQWVSGLISQEYFPVVIVQDYLPSIRGKPAMDVVSYYFNELMR